MTAWSGAHGGDPFTLQYRGCGKEGKHIYFTPDFLLNDDLTAGYGPRGKKQTFAITFYNILGLVWKRTQRTWNLPRLTLLLGDRPYTHEKMRNKVGQKELSTRLMAPTVSIVRIQWKEKTKDVRNGLIEQKIFKVKCHFDKRKMGERTVGIVWINLFQQKNPGHI